MLHLLKKKSDTANVPLVPNWHPNFRNYEKLPDIKVVRTAFFLNIAAGSVALVLGGYCGFREFVELKGINAQIVEKQREIDRDKNPSDQAVAMFKKFQAEEARVLEVDAFVKSKPLVSVLLRRMGETLPANVAIDNIDLRQDGLALRLSVRGDAVAASGYATAYLDQLKADKELSPFGEFTFTNTPTRNPTSGRMAVEFFLRFKAPAAGGKKQ
jgi:hypothetical protein